jgi:hypothetical protein
VFGSDESSEDTLVELYQTSNHKVWPAEPNIYTAPTQFDGLADGRPTAPVIDDDIPVTFHDWEEEESQALPRPFKRIIACCDGTWVDASDTSEPESNVARFSRCVAPSDDQGHEQKVIYQPGLGRAKNPNSLTGFITRYVGGGSGWGELHSDIRVTGMADV